MVGCGLQSSGQLLQLKVDHGELLKGLMVVLLDCGEDVQGEPAGECKGELVERLQSGQQHWRHDGLFGIWEERGRRGSCFFSLCFCVFLCFFFGKWEEG